VKTFTGSISTLALGFPFRSTVLTGLALAQIGEFSFILSRSGLSMGLLGGGTYQVILGITILTMAATPFIINASPALADMAVRLPLPSRILTGLSLSGRSSAGQDPPQKLKGHLVVIGYGINGRNVSRAAAMAGIPHSSSK
jgi:CPA2 family monovalent cation:H+ antiporter-2